MSNQLISDLQQPNAFPHETGNIRLIETHISWVIVTQQYAYKIKKPVNFGFLDYSTLELRKQYCQHELNLNQALAAEIYQEVVPIYQTATGYSFIAANNTSAPVEYALKMHTFPQNSLLSEVITDNKNPEVLMLQLAESIAIFHGNAEKAEMETPYGLPETVYKPVGENFSEARPFLTEEADLTLLAQLEEQAQTLFQKIHPLMQQRKESGYIRACHGDIHLGNITLLNDMPVIFDCIEFNEYFRWLDPMAEIAFLIMDLQYRGYGHYAALFLNAYLEKTGDYEGIPLLRFYIAYRAMVRAKIQLFTLANAPEAEKAELLNCYRKYAQLAAAQYQETLPALAITHGVSGSGKSTTAKHLVNEYAFIRIRSDAERKRMQLGKDEQLYSREFTQQVYQRLENLAACLLEAGYCVVIDAANLKQSQRNLFSSLAKVQKVPFCILSCQAPKEFLVDAITKRQSMENNISDATVEVLNQQLDNQESLRETETDDVITLHMQTQYNFDTLKETLLLKLQLASLNESMVI